MLHETLGHRLIDLRVDHGDGLVPQDDDAIDDMAKQIDTLGDTLERAIGPTGKRVHSLLSTYFVLLDDILGKRQAQTGFVGHHQLPIHKGRGLLE